jgi:YD repeat-containing protein
MFATPRRIDRSHLSGDGTRTYTYDALNRVTRAQDTAGGSDDFQFEYDGNANLTKATESWQTTTGAASQAKTYTSTFAFSGPGGGVAAAGLSVGSAYFGALFTQAGDSGAC